MARRVETVYGTEVEIGTRADDGRLGPESLYLKAGRDRQEFRILTPAQALKLAAALLETVSELEEERS